MALVNLLLILCPLVQAFSRYNPSEGVVLDEALLFESEVTLFSSYPIQDPLYKFLANSHAWVALPMVALFTFQIFRTKGDSLHVLVGQTLKYTGIIAVIGGWAIHVRHSFLSTPAVFNEHPTIFPIDMVKSVVSVFGTCMTVSFLNTFYLAVKPSNRQIAVGGSAYNYLMVLALVSFLLNFWAYGYMIDKIINASGFLWEINFEWAIIGSVFPLYDVLTLYCMWKARNLPEDKFPWKGQHIMCSVFLVGKGFGAVLLFLAHDARHLWPYPGLNLIPRLLIQLLPWLALNLYYLKPMVRHVSSCSAIGRKKSD